MKGRDIVEYLGNQIPNSETLHGGFSRNTFLKYFLFLVAMTAVFAFMQVNVGAKYLKEILILAITLIVPIFFWAVAQRLKNIGIQQMWCVLLLVPVINFLLLSGCFICPEGYLQTKKLDRAGKVSVGIIVILTIILLIACIIGLTRG